MVPDKISAAAILKWSSAVVVGFWVHSIPAAMRTLIFFMFVDCVTGIVASWYGGSISSRSGVKGLTTKGAILVLLMISHQVETLVHVELNLESTGAIGYAFNEVISILENFNRLGVPLPGGLVRAMTAAKSLRARAATPEEVKAMAATSQQPL